MSRTTFSLYVLQGGEGWGEVGFAAAAILPGEIHFVRRSFRMLIQRTGIPRLTPTLSTPMGWRGRFG